MRRVVQILPGLVGAIVAYVAIQFTDLLGFSGGLFELLIFLAIYLFVTGVMSAGVRNSRYPRAPE
ncbi:MAG: hypothetical protein O3A21_04225 [Proteobacteria bacterium]|nr:hypothetical protein [Pseudomonadota bacterium]